MLAASHRKTRLAGTGFTKVTAALNNPTPLHVDEHTIGVTVLAAFDVSSVGKVSLAGASHIVVSDDMMTA
eukprot:5894103-Pleurochrysis_carterae.AAC.1